MGADLVTLAEYKAYAGISSPTLDAQINILIPAVSSLVKEYCRRSFVDYVTTPKIEKFKGGSELSLSEYPTINVISVEQSSDYGQTYTALTEYTDWVLDTEDYTIVPGSTSPGFIYAPNAYKVTYTAGFQPVPEDIKIACLDIIMYYLKNDGAVHNSRLPTGATLQIQYVMSTAFPSHIQRILELYKANYS